MPRAKASQAKKAAIVDSIDKLFAEISPTDALILTAGFIAGTKGYTPISAMINIASGISSGSVTGSLYNIDPVLKAELTWAAGLTGVPGILGSYIALWSKPKEEQTVQEKEFLATFGDSVAMGCIGMLEGYAVTRPGTLAGVGEIVKGVGSIIPG